MTRRAPSVRASVVALTIAAACAACSAPDSHGPPGRAPAPSASVDPETTLIDTVVEQSHDDRYDDVQAEILADRSVDYAEYERAIGKALECMRGTGAVIDVEGPQMREGKTQIVYSITVPNDDDTVLADADRCYERYAGLVDAFWQATGPEVRDFEDRRAEALTPVLRTCLTKYGVDWAEDESFDDLLDKAFRLLESEKSDCILEIGYPTWQG